MSSPPNPAIQISESIDPTRPTVLYGAGGLTQMALNIWPKQLPKPIAIIDKNFAGRDLRIFDVPVFNLSFFQNTPIDNLQVILSAFKANIFDIFHDLGKFNITISATTYDLLNAYIPEKFSNGWGIENEKSSFRNEIFNISKLFTDQKSKDILEDVFLWRALRTIKGDIYDRIDDELHKYVNPLTIPYIKEATYIIDGGSFDGKSSVQFSAFTKPSCHFSLYEPDTLSFQKLKKTTFQSFTPKLFEAALSDKFSKEEFFFSTGGLSSRLVKKIGDSNGVTTTTTIDNEASIISSNIKYKSLIKLHIEGEEFNALLGAEKLIREYRPTWIINCSHNAEQLLETPKFLSSYGYSKMYLRCHSLFGEGLTLYAFP
jgi:FkbM family methyltransferase